MIYRYILHVSWCRDVNVSQTIDEEDFPCLHRNSNVYRAFPMLTVISHVYREFLIHVFRWEIHVSIVDLTVNWCLMMTECHNVRLLLLLLWFWHDKMYTVKISTRNRYCKTKCVKNKHWSCIEMKSTVWNTMCTKNNLK